MTLITASWPARGRVDALAPWLGPALVMLGCAGFLFIDLRTMPIVLWDESRIAVNALEMHLSGRLSLVTTYGFSPDLWNTKPPLLIWLMDLSVSLFGVSEWSLRLPSMVAALGTLALVMSFTRRVSGSFPLAALAVVLLTISLRFFGEHSARTADYEALLSFLTTAYLYLLFFTLHRRRPGWQMPLLIGALVGLAVLTKGVAGLLPGLGVPLYLMVVRRWARPFRAWGYVVGAVLVGATVAGFLILREHAAAGYLRAMMFNDVAGRFASALDSHTGPPWYYLQDLAISQTFAGGPLALASPLALLTMKGRQRLALIFSLCVVCATLLVLSLGATKLSHYGATVLPFLAVSTALAVGQAGRALQLARVAGLVSSPVYRISLALSAAALAMAFGHAGYIRTVLLPQREFEPQSLYGELFADLSAQGLTAARVVESGIVKPGVQADGVAGDYAPQFDFYRLLARSRGMDIQRISPAGLALQPARALLASCDPTFTPSLRARGSNLSRVVGCVAVRRGV